MFTGIIEEVGKVQHIARGKDSSRLAIAADRIFSDLHLGDSIAVNGVCLTAAELTADGFTADVMHETLRRTNLGTLAVGAPVDLERAMAADGRFGGHIVSGHIDGTGQIRTVTADDNAIWYEVATGPALMRYIVEKGSIAIDGISLTVAAVTADSFSVSLIPHTASHTILANKKPGDAVNLENDLVAKYIEKLVNPADSPVPSALTKEKLTQYGYSN